MSIPLRVRHLLSPTSISLKDFILSQIDLPENSFFELLDLGAIYLNQKRCFSEQALNPGDYVRVHVTPKRFPLPEFNVGTTIVAEENDFLVVDKPQGYPCHPMVDNVKENWFTFMQEFLRAPIFLTHRLDIGTGGLWLIAKTPEFQKKFNQALQQNLSHKIYRARVENAWLNPPANLVHFMRPSSHSPKEIFSENSAGFQECRLEILESVPSLNYTDLKIRLVTGRTHQIRAQMAKCGHPVVGDILYGSKFNFHQGRLERWALLSENLSFAIDGKNYEFTLSPERLRKILDPFQIPNVDGLST